jgi:hypothetical protein
MLAPQPQKAQAGLLIWSLAPKRAHLGSAATLCATKVLAEPRHRQTIWEFAYVEGRRRAGLRLHPEDAATNSPGLKKGPVELAGL